LLKKSPMRDSSTVLESLGWGHPLDWLARPLNILGDGLTPANSSPVGR
jgi:hypothetical protein